MEMTNVFEGALSDSALDDVTGGGLLSAAAKAALKEGAKDVGLGVLASAIYDGIKWLLSD
jgi:hypothetical protein